MKDKQRRINLKMQVLNQYGGKCVCCKTTTMEFLSMDHINGGGTYERRHAQKRIWTWLKDNKYPEGFQILCFNCNLSKGFNGYCPHELLDNRRRPITHRRTI